METISLDILKNIAGKEGFNIYLIEKDYYLTLFLYILRKEKLFFKGGTALYKIYLNYKRLSEDLDFSYKENINVIKNKILELKGNFKDILINNETNNFIRFSIFYSSYFGKEGKVIIDIK